MANHKAISAVSRTLERLLKARMTFGPPEVSFLPPDKLNDDKDRLNLYLFQVIPNGCLANQEIPGRGHPATYGKPPLALDLQYLLTAVPKIPNDSEDTKLSSQVLLGDAMRVLHEYPILSTKGPKERIEDNSNDGNSKQSVVPILDKELRDEFEKIKISLLSWEMDEIARLWSAFHDAKFRLSVIYHVSAIQIDESPRSHPRLVGKPPEQGPRLHIFTFRSPRINEIRFKVDADPKTEEQPYLFGRIGDRIVILGSSLVVDDNTVVQIGEVEFKRADFKPEDQVIFTDRRIEFEIRDDDLKLQPGATSVQIVQHIPIGETQRRIRSYESNSAVFMLVPEIDRVWFSRMRTIYIEGKRLYHNNLTGEIVAGPYEIRKEDYDEKLSDRISVKSDIATDELWDLPALNILEQISAKHINPDGLELTVATPKILINVPVTNEEVDSIEIQLMPKPTTLNQAAERIVEAVRNIPDEQIKRLKRPGAIRNLLVSVEDQRLVIESRDLRNDLIFGMTDEDTTTAEELKLDSLTVRVRCFSGVYKNKNITFKTKQPKLRVTMGEGEGSTQDITLEFEEFDVSIEQVANTFELALNDADTDLQQFLQATIKVELTAEVPGERPAHQELVITPGLPVECRFETHPEDQETLGILKLEAPLIRVRVNGAEALEVIPAGVPKVVNP